LDLKKEDTALLEKLSGAAVGDKTLFGIKEVSEMLCVHQQTLRNWERKKVVVPLRAGDRRVYTAEHIELCRKIKEFSGKGVPLKGIKEIINKI
jgi:MerR family transcriptional regulator/heat shock protein HspR